MAMYSTNLLAIALELARVNPSYEDVASKFWEHFLYIANAMSKDGGRGIDLWDEQDGFFYDVLHLPDDSRVPLRVRSMVGLIPLFAVETLEPEIMRILPGFSKRLDWFIVNRPDLTEHAASMSVPGHGERRLLSVVDRDQLRRILEAMLNEGEFLSPHGIPRPVPSPHGGTVPLRGRRHRILSGVRTGRVANRPVRREFQLARARVVPGELPADRGAAEVPPLLRAGLHRRMSGRIGHAPDARRGGRGIVAPRLAPVPEGRERRAAGERHESRFRDDPWWRDWVLFYEYFDGDTGAGLGASHQTGWTGLVAKLLQQSGE
jgi:hypothetical protein